MSDEAVEMAAADVKRAYQETHAAKMAVAGIMVAMDCFQLRGQKHELLGDAWENLHNAQEQLEAAKKAVEQAVEAKETKICQ